MKYNICLSSPPDREKLVAEIFFDNIQWAEINQEHGFFQIEFYSHPESETWSIPFSEAISALNEAQNMLKKSNS